MLNPDGVEYQIHGPDPEHALYPRLLSMNGGSRDFSHWQANARGVDLNHNYNAGFLAYKEYEREHQIPCGAPTKYSGTCPESEPESAALCNYIRFISAPKLLLSLHTQGEEIYYSSNGQIPERSHAILRCMTEACGYTPAIPTASAAFGGLLDWCIQSLGIPAFTLECGKGENPLPLTDASPIYARLRMLLFTLPTLV
jgi:g-D-glutamyl-meso-diaminopimelate peptidase